MKVLFIGSHCDDIEINCGATISKYVREGHEVHCLALSDCDEEGLLEEYFESMKYLGVKNIGHGVIKQRVFSEQRQSILNTLIGVKNEILFDRVFTHSVHDIHQDHKVVAEETIRAFRGCDILTYCNPYNSTYLAGNYFVEVSLEDMHNKINAVNLYKTQKNKTYMRGNVIMSLADVRGVQAGCTQAEAFEVVRMKE